MGRFFLTIMAGVAEMERNLIRERTRAAMGHLKDNGLRVGSIPYGYTLATDRRTLLPLQEEQRVVAMARKLASEGLSLRRISAALHAQGVSSRTGKRFLPTQIRRMLQ